MPHRLVELEGRALRLKNSGKLAEAAELFSEIVEEQPDWEHGMGLHCLGQCCERLGRLDEAKKHYLAALAYEPADNVLLGGFASFLYLHGRPEDAFDAHIKLLIRDRSVGSKEDVRSSMIALYALGDRMGWLHERTAAAIERGST